MCATGGDESQRSAAMQPVASSSPVLRKLTQLDQMAPGLGHRIGKLFLEDSRTRIAELALSLTSGDADAVADIAHAIRGAAANVGADAMARASTSLQGLGRAGNLAEARSSFDRLSEAFAQVRKDLSSAGLRDAA